jgi:hypothetical protein
MPIYSIEGPDSRIYKIEGPENASEKDLFAAAQQYMQEGQKRERQQAVETAAQEAEAARKLAEAPTPEGGFLAAAKSSGYQLAADTKRLAGRTGIMDTEKAEASAKESEKTAAETFKPTEEGWTESPWLKFKELAGQSAAYTVAPLAAGVLAGTAPVSGALGLTAGVAGALGAGLASAAQFTGSNLSRQVQENGVRLADTDLMAAGAAAIPQAMLDVVSFKMMPGINKIFKSAGKELTEEQLKAIAQRNILTNVGMTGGKVAGVEGLTEVGQQFLERLQAGISTTDAGAREEYLDSLIGGAVLGGAFGGVSGVGARGRAQRELGARETRAAQEEAAKTEYNQRVAGAEQLNLLPDEMQGPAAPVTAPAPTAASASAPVQNLFDAQGNKLEPNSALQAYDAYGASVTPPAVASTAASPESLPLDFGERRQAELEQTFGSQSPDLLGDIVPARGAASAPVQNLFDAQGNKLEPSSALQAYDAYGASVTPSAVAPIEVRIKELTQALISAGVPPKEAGIAAYKQARNEQRDDTLAEMQSGAGADPRQGALQFAPAAPAPTSQNAPLTQMQSEMGYTAAEQQREAQKQDELDKLAQQSSIQRDLTDAGLTEEPKGAAPISPIQAGQPTQQQQLDLFSRKQAPVPSRAEGIRQGVGTQVEEQAPAQPATTVDEAAVDFLYLPKNAAVRQNILGKDLSDPAQRTYVADQLKAARNAYAARNDPRSRTAVKRINEILSQSPFVRTQGEMFGPRGGVLEPQAQPKAPKQGGTNANTGTTAQPAAQPAASQQGMGVDSTGVPAGTGVSPSTAGISTPASTGLGGADLGTKSNAPAAKNKSASVKKKTEAELEAEENAREEALQAQAEADVDAGPIGQAIAKIEDGDIETKAQVRALATRLEKNGVLDDVEDVREGLSDREQDADDVISTLSDLLDSARDAAIDERIDELREEAEAEAEAAPKATPETKAEAKAETKAEAKAAPEAEVLPKGEQDNGLTAAEQEAEVARLKAQNDVAATSPIAHLVAQWGQPAPVVAAKETKGKGKKLKLEEALDGDLPDNVQAQLQAGNLTDALNTLAAQTGGLTGRILKLLMRGVTDTKVKVVNNLKDDAGKPISGMFDPETNTITLDSKTGLNNHTLIHETVHGALSHVLDNANHPVTKQLTALFNKVKPSLDSAYGATSVQEFVAEAWGNQEFRTKLAGINPDGTAISALQKFTNIIKNFVRRLMGAEPKAVESAFDQVDRLMEAAISPAPDSRVGEALYMASANGNGAGVMGNLIDGVINNIPYTSSQTKNEIHHGITTTLPRGAQGAVLTTLPLPAFAEVASVDNTLPQAAQLNRVVQKHEGRLDVRLEKIEAVNGAAIKWWNGQSDSVKTNFKDVANTASRVGVDLFDPNARKAFMKDPAELKEFDALKAKFDKLDAPAKAVYKDILNTYKQLRDDGAANLGAMVKDSITDPATSAHASSIIQKLFTQMGSIKGYVPFERKGEYRLSYELPNAPTPIVRQFENPKDRADAIAEAKAEGAMHIQEFSKLSEFNYKNTPAGSFMNTIVNTMQINKVPQNVMDKVIEQWIDMMPETSFAQGFRKRKGTLGFNEDVLDVFSRKPYTFARQVTNMETAGQVRSLLTKAREHINATGATEEGRKFLREFERRASFAMNPDVANWSNLMTTATFGMTLGANISSSIVNLTSIPIIIGPYLAGQYGPAASAGAVGTATRMFLGSGTSHTVDGKKVKGGFSIENYDFNDPNLPPEIRRLKTLVERGKETGQFGRSLAKDILDTNKGGSKLAKVNAFMGYMMHHTERMNRQVSLTAAYTLELDRLDNNPKPAERGLSQQQKENLAFEKSLGTTELLNGGTSAMAAPSIAQGSIGRIAFMYKRYGVTQYYMLYKTAKDALTGADPEVRKQAWKQLGWVSGSATLLAGVRGAPLYGAARLLYDMFKNDDDDNFDTVMRKFAGDTAYGGLFNAATGLEIGSRVGLTDMIFKPSQSSSDKQTALDMAVEFVGGPAYGTAKRMIRGADLINEGHFSRGLEQMLPATLGNALKSTRYGAEGANTLRGDPITSEISPWNVGAQAFGFAPAEYTRQLEINANEKAISRYETEHRTKMLREFYMATRQGDSEGASNVMEQIQKWNAKHPYKGVAVTADTIRASMKQHMKETMMAQHGISISKARMPEFLRSMQEYEGN